MINNKPSSTLAPHSTIPDIAIISVEIDRLKPNETYRGITVTIGKDKTTFNKGLGLSVDMKAAKGHINDLGLDYYFSDVNAYLDNLTLE